MIQNEVLNCIHTRRSVRSFQQKQIKDEELAILLDAAIWAPSGGNNQKWLFTAVQNQSHLLKLNELVRDGFQTWIPDDDYPGKKAAKAFARKEIFNFYYHAPTIIIASYIPNHENAMADCSLAMENIFLAAQSMKIGTCYLNYLHWLRNDTTIRDYLTNFGIPKEHTICSSAAIGYIDHLSPAPARKPGTTHIIH